MTVSDVIRDLLILQFCTHLVVVSSLAIELVLSELARIHVVITEDQSATARLDVVHKVAQVLITIAVEVGALAIELAIAHISLIRVAVLQLDASGGHARALRTAPTQLRRRELDGRRRNRPGRGCDRRRWVIANRTKIQSPNTLPIILNCVIVIIN